MPRFTAWLQRHRLAAFVVLAFAISWSSWPLYAAGLMPRMEFLPIYLLVLIVAALGTILIGRSGWRTAPASAVDAGPGQPAAAVPRPTA